MTRPTRMPFGKHRGWLVSRLPNAYLKWLVTLPDLREPLRGAVKAELARRGAPSDRDPRARPSSPPGREPARGTATRKPTPATAAPPQGTAAPAPRTRPSEPPTPHEPALSQPAPHQAGRSACPPPWVGTTCPGCAVCRPELGLPEGWMLSDAAPHSSREQSVVTPIVTPTPSIEDEWAAVMAGRPTRES
jgi:hypothetical protein